MKNNKASRNINVLIVYAHPSTKSYTFQILEQLKMFLSNKGDCNIVVSDLYAMNFKSDMSNSEYDREGFANFRLAIPDDVLLEHRKIEVADCIIFLYPVWWSDCPAKMKGWFDRVYSAGYAYGHNEKVKKMDTKKSGLVICTAGHSNAFLQEIGVEQSMRTIMLEDRLGKRFHQKEMIILGGTLEIEKVRRFHSQELIKIADKILVYCANRHSLY